MRLLPEVEEAWKKVEADLRQKWTEPEPAENDSRFGTLDRNSDDPENSSKVIRLDRVILAAHLIAARYSFTSMPKIMEFLTSKYREVIEGLLGKSAAKKALGGRITTTVVIQALSQLEGIVRENVIQAGIEARIRNISHGYRVNIASIPFARRIHPRKTKLVYTRK